jgi:hypothetical protein
MNSTTDLAFLLKETDATYHAQAKDNLSSHQLADFRKCPSLYLKKKEGLVEDIDRPAFLFGRAVHTLTLEGRDAFEQAYAFGGPINPKTGTYFGALTKAYGEWAAQQGKPTLTDEQVTLAVRLADAVRSHEGARLLLSEGVAEGVLREQYCELPCQIRIDWFNPRAGIVDLKTCDDLTWFEADARRYGYAHQMAFYRSVLNQAIHSPMPVNLIAVEKKEPYRCGVWRISDDVIAYAAKENEAAIGRLKDCIQKSNFPTGYEESRVFDFI